MVRSNEDEYEGLVSFSRVSGPEGDFMRISVEDAESSCPAFHVDMELDRFGKALAGLSFQPVDYWLPEAHHPIGLVHEVKRERVFVSKGNMRVLREKDKWRCRELVEEYETEGWVGRAGDLLSHHNIVDHAPMGEGWWYTVVFDRYVDPKKTPDPK